MDLELHRKTRTCIKRMGRAIAWARVGELKFPSEVEDENAGSDTKLQVLNHKSASMPPRVEEEIFKNWKDAWIDEAPSEEVENFFDNQAEQMVRGEIIYFK